MHNLISVIIVSYNASLTIEMAILSVLNQKRENIELLIIDGKSTDNTIEIAKRYQVRVDAGEFSGKTLRFVSDTDDGIYDAMNKGINFASGNWLLFLGADDFLLPMFSDACEKVKDNDTIYYCNTFLNKHQFVYNGKFNRYKLGIKNICHQTIFYPKQILQKYYYNTDYRFSADYYLNILCYFDKLIKFEYIPIVVSVFNELGSCNTLPDNKFIKDKFVILNRYLGVDVAISSYVYTFIKSLVK